MRPFLGNAAGPVSFFRSGAWGNAYVVVGRLALAAARRLAPNPTAAALWIVALVGLGGLVVSLVRSFGLRQRGRKSALDPELR